VSAAPHVPFAAAPSDVEHTSQAAPHAELQQKPSAQLPLEQARQPATSQSWLAATLQAAPWALRGWHVLSLAQ
jgi:hypothetical protein